MGNIAKSHILQIHSNFLILRQDVAVNRNFALSNIGEFELHDRLLSELWAASITLSNALHVADKLIRGQIVINDNSRFLETCEMEL